MDKKQVVFIIVDTLRTDLTSCYKDVGVKTPNIDQLAAEGIKFNKAYTCQPVCGPARSALMYGTFPHSNGSWSNSAAVYQNSVSVGRRLKDRGVHCGYMGKWHLDGFDYFGDGICPPEFDEKYWYDMRCYLMDMDQDERINSRRQDYAREKNLPAEYCYGTKVSNRAIDFLDEYKGQDFFLTVSYDEPHHPYLAPAEYAHMYDDFVFPNKENTRDTLEGKPFHQKLWAGDNLKRDPDTMVKKYPEYFGSIAYVDNEIGRVVAKIKEVAPDAMIIFTTDHGDMLESHCLSGKGPVNYEEVSHIPFIVSGKHVGDGQEYDMMVSHIDFTPTLLDYFGVPQAQVLQGKSLMPAIKDVTVRVNDYAFTEFGRFELDHDMYGGLQLMRAVQCEQYKLNVNLLSSDELYDLVNDPEEMHNLIEDPAHYETACKLHDALMDWMHETRDPFRGYVWEDRHWRKNNTENVSWAGRGYTRNRIDTDYEHLMLTYESAEPITPENRERRKSMWFGRWRDTQFASLYNGKKKD